MLAGLSEAGDHIAAFLSAAHVQLVCGASAGVAALWRPARDRKQALLKREWGEAQDGERWGWIGTAGVTGLVRLMDCRNDFFVFRTPYSFFVPHEMEHTLLRHASEFSVKWTHSGTDRSGETVDGDAMERRVRGLRMQWVSMGDSSSEFSDDMLSTGDSGSQG